MKNIAIISIMAGFMTSGISAQAQSIFISNKLEKVWEISNGLDVPESSYYNPIDKTIYVSNIVGKHDVKDGIGYISKVSIKGEIIQKEWVKGLNGPKGMCATNAKLFITDFDRVLEIDLKTGAILKEFRNSKSEDLNDAVIASDGRVFISDSGSDCIFYIVKDSLEIFLEDEKIKGMNGIYTEGNLLYIGAKGNLLSIDIQTNEIKSLVEDVGYLDGLIKINETQFLTSDWKGTVQLIDINGVIEKLLDTSSENIGAADLGYIPSEKMLLVPTFFNNRVVAYKIKFRN